MKNIFRGALVALAVTIVGSSAVTAATSLTSTATATVIGPLAITQTQAMSFGSFTAGSTAGTVNTYSQTTGGVTAINNGVLGQPAGFSITGAPSTNFQLVLPSTVTLNNGSASMVATFDSFNRVPLNASGVYNALVTATLAVPANQTGGSYSGTYNVSVNY